MSANPNVVAFRHDLESDAMREQLRIALPKHVDLDAFARTVMTSVQSNYQLCNAERKSLLAACMEAAQDGLLPDGREGAIVPYRMKGGPLVAQWQPMVGGLLRLVRQSGELVEIAAHIVRRSDRFDYVVDERGEHFQHHPNFMEPDTPPLLVYAYARTKDGGLYFEPMAWSEIEKFQAMSRATSDESPWHMWPDEMAKVRPIKRLCKRLPMSTDARAVLARDDARDANLLGLAPADPLVAMNRVISQGNVPPMTAPAVLTHDAHVSPPEPDSHSTPQTVGTEGGTASPVRDEKPRRSRAARRSEAPDVPTLDEVLQAIALAQSGPELATAGEQAARLRTDAEKEIARTAYADRMQAARAIAHAGRSGSLADVEFTDTAEPPATEPPAARPGIITYVEVVEAMNAASDRDVLVAAADLIRYVIDEGQREKLAQLYQDRVAKFDGGQ